MATPMVSSTRAPPQLKNHGGTELVLNVPEHRHDVESPKRTVVAQKLTVRRFLILTISIVTSAAIWQRTGGDVALTGFATVATPSALSHWIAE